MRFRLIGLLALCCVFAVILSVRSETSHSQTNKQTPQLSKSELDLLAEINLARAQPQVYADYLEKLKPQFKGKLYTASGQDTALETQEGWDAVEDAIKFLRGLKPVGPLSTSQGLCMAASSHVKDQSASGATGHAGADKMLVEQRVKPFGAWQGDIGENLVYGDESARERILTWLIDDGVTTRGHRRRVMSQNYKVAGISCGPHPEYGTMCVLTLAGGFTDSGGGTSATGAQKSENVLKNRPPNATLTVTTPANSNAAKSSNSSTTSTNKNKSPR
ncbi:MAG TPA: CAP domain-containing protein [Pyrinomonadaceae bacterium]|nr:CAP domain-containing protein [Pyrinomonadaceae bacterium]